MIELTRSQQRKVLVKQIVSAVGYHASPWRYLLRKRPPFGVFIIVYHQVVPRSYPFAKPYTSVSPESFETQMRFFKENFTIYRSKRRSGWLAGRIN